MAGLKEQVDTLVKELEERINRTIASDERLSETAIVLRSIPRIRAVASAMLIAEMPETGFQTSLHKRRSAATKNVRSHPLHFWANLLGR